MTRFFVTIASVAQNVTLTKTLSNFKPIPNTLPQFLHLNLFTLHLSEAFALNFSFKFPNSNINSRL